MNQSYLKNVKPINTLKNYSSPNLSDKFNYLNDKDSFNNMVINSNLDNENLIK